MPNGEVLTTREFFTRYGQDRIPVVLSNKDFWKRIPAGDRFLDVGCGLGDDIEKLRSVYPEAEIVGVDRQPEMVTLYPKAILADATELPFENKYFDVAYANCVLCENGKEEKKRIIKEMRRVALRVFICDTDKEGNFTYATF